MASTSTTEHTADVAKARTALEKFLKRCAARQFGAALKYVQTSWIQMHTPLPAEQVKIHLATVMPAGFKVTSTVVSEDDIKGQVPKVFSDCMVDLPFSISAESKERSYHMTGVARVICERGYMKPDPKGKWGVNPTSMSRGEREYTART